MFHNSIKFHSSMLGLSKYKSINISLSSLGVDSVAPLDLDEARRKAEEMCALSEDSEDGETEEQSDGEDLLGGTSTKDLAVNLMDNNRNMRRVQRFNESSQLLHLSSHHDTPLHFSSHDDNRRPRQARRANKRPQQQRQRSSDRKITSASRARSNSPTAARRAQRKPGRRSYAGGVKGNTSLAELFPGLSQLSSKVDSGASPVVPDENDMEFMRPIQQQQRSRSEANNLEKGEGKNSQENAVGTKMEPPEDLVEMKRLGRPSLCRSKSDKDLRISCSTLNTDDQSISLLSAVQQKPKEEDGLALRCEESDVQPPPLPPMNQRSEIEEELLNLAGDLSPKRLGRPSLCRSKSDKNLHISQSSMSFEDSIRFLTSQLPPLEKNKEQQLSTMEESSSSLILEEHEESTANVENSDSMAANPNETERVERPFLPRSKPDKNFDSSSSSLNYKTWFDESLARSPRKGAKAKSLKIDSGSLRRPDDVPKQPSIPEDDVAGEMGELELFARPMLRRTLSDKNFESSCSSLNYAAWYDESAPIETDNNSPGKEEPAKTDSDLLVQPEESTNNIVDERAVSKDNIGELGAESEKFSPSKPSRSRSDESFVESEKFTASKPSRSRSDESFGESEKFTASKPSRSRSNESFGFGTNSRLHESNDKISKITRSKSEESNGIRKTRKTSKSPSRRPRSRSPRKASSPRKQDDGGGGGDLGKSKVSLEQSLSQLSSVHHTRAKRRSRPGELGGLSSTDHGDFERKQRRSSIRRDLSSTDHSERKQRSSIRRSKSSDLSEMAVTNDNKNREVRKGRRPRRRSQVETTNNLLEEEESGRRRSPVRRSDSGGGDLAEKIDNCRGSSPNRPTRSRSKQRSPKSRERSKSVEWSRDDQPQNWHDSVFNPLADDGQQQNTIDMTTNNDDNDNVAEPQRKKGDREIRPRRRSMCDEVEEPINVPHIRSTCEEVAEPINVSHVGRSRWES